MRLAISRDPYSLMNRLQQSMLEDDFFNMNWDDTELDMFEEGEEVIVQLKAPGFDDKSVEVSIEGNTLTITGNIEQTQEDEDKKRKYYRKEIRTQSFTRSVSLPAKVDPEKVDASFKNGLLTVRMAKAEEAKPRKIQVQIK